MIVVKYELGRRVPPVDLKAEGYEIRKEVSVSARQGLSCRFGNTAKSRGPQSPAQLSDLCGSGNCYTDSANIPTDSVLPIFGNMITAIFI
jgi:hypothetical protein